MTAIVAFTFGSLGDIISLLQIANAVRTALCDIKGASAEYRDLLAELDSLVYTIASVQRTLSVHGPDRLSQSVENGLYHAVHVCMRLLTQANERIAAFRSLTTSSLWRRVGWMLVRKDEVVALRLRLSEQIKAINTLLTLAQGDQLESVQAVAREQHALVVEIHRCVKNLSQRLGYLWEGGPDADSLPVKLTFAGPSYRHVITLPWELCTSEELFDNFLRFYTRDEFRGQFVRDGTYVLTVGEGDDNSAVLCEMPNEGYDEELGGIATYGTSGMHLHTIYTLRLSRPRKHWDVRPGITFNFDYLESFVELPISKRPMLLSWLPIVSSQLTTVSSKGTSPWTPLQIIFPMTRGGPTECALGDCAGCCTVNMGRAIFVDDAC